MERGGFSPSFDFAANFGRERSAPLEILFIIPLIRVDQITTL